MRTQPPCLFSSIFVSQRHLKNSVQSDLRHAVRNGANTPFWERTHVVGNKLCTHISEQSDAQRRSTRAIDVSSVTLVGEQPTHTPEQSGSTGASARFTPSIYIARKTAVVAAAPADSSHLYQAGNVVKVERAGDDLDRLVDLLEHLQPAREHR